MTDPWAGNDREREFVYINSFHGLKLKRGTTLTYSGGGKPRIGKVAWDMRDGYVAVLFDGEKVPEGPFHPTRKITYAG